MGSTTSLTPLPYPDPTDQPFVHLDIKALAEATTESLYVSSETAPAHKVGRRWIKPSTKRAYVSDGTDWWQVSGPPVDLTLTYISPYGTGSGSTGASNPLRLFKINRTCYAVGTFKNPGGAVTVGTNIQQPFANLPAAAKPVIDAAITSGNRRINFPAVSTTSGVGFRLGTFIVADDTDQLCFQPGADLRGVAANSFSLNVGVCQWETATMAAI